MRSCLFLVQSCPTALKPEDAMKISEMKLADESLRLFLIHQFVEKKMN